MKNNKALRWIVVIILVAISLYQFMNEDISSEPQNPEPATATSIQIDPTDTPQPATDVLEADVPTTSEPPLATATEANARCLM